MARCTPSEKGARYAFIAAVVQGSLFPLGLAIGQADGMETLSIVLSATYFISAYPAELLEVFGIRLSGGFLGWPTTAGFMTGLIMWFLLYWAVTTLVIAHRERKRKSFDSY